MSISVIFQFLFFNPLHFFLAYTYVLYVKLLVFISLSIQFTSVFSETLQRRADYSFQNQECFVNRNAIAGRNVQPICRVEAKLHGTISLCKISELARVRKY